MAPCRPRLDPPLVSARRRRSPGPAGRRHRAPRPAHARTVAAPRATLALLSRDRRSDCADDRRRTRRAPSLCHRAAHDGVRRAGASEHSSGTKRAQGGLTKTGNAHLFRKLSRGRADVFSAGTSPEAEVHPLALDVLRTRFNVDTDVLFPKHLDRFRGHRFDFVITVCDRAAETVRPSLEIRSGSTGVSRILPAWQERRPKDEPSSSSQTVYPGDSEYGWRYLVFRADLMPQKNEAWPSTAGEEQSFRVVSAKGPYGTNVS
jgi:protein-tyrosine-phosphatase